MAFFSLLDTKTRLHDFIYETSYPLQLVAQNGIPLESEQDQADGGDDQRCLTPQQHLSSLVGHSRMPGRSSWLCCCHRSSSHSRSRFILFDRPIEIFVEGSQCLQYGED